jgi:uncharacterized protein
MPMKEVLTKKFWKDAKKTFEEARDGTAVKAGDSAAPSTRLVNREESGADGQQGRDLTDSDQRGHTIDDSVIREIVQRLLGVSQPQRIILFGSASTGQMTRDSDVDLLVVAPDSLNTIDERVKLLRALRGLGFPFDVFIIGPERFEETKNVFGGIAYPAHKYGRVIYEAG